MHGLTVYMKEGLPFAWELSLENSADSYLSFRLALLHSVSYFIFLYRSPSLSLCTVFDPISSNIDEVLSNNPSANMFAVADFNVHHKDWLTYSAVLIDLVNSVILFISNDLTQMVNFPTCIPGCDSLSSALLDSLILLVLVFVLQWLSLHLEILTMLSQFPLIFEFIQNRMPRFIA